MYAKRMRINRMQIGQTADLSTGDREFFGMPAARSLFIFFQFEKF